MRGDVSCVSSAGSVAGCRRAMRDGRRRVMIARGRARTFVIQRIAHAALRRATPPMVQLTDDSRNARNSRYTRERALKTRSRTMRERRKTRVETSGVVARGEKGVRETAL